MNSSSAKRRGRAALGLLSSPIADAVWRRSLTVVCYHRIGEQVEPGLFPEVLSATPAMLERHLDSLGDAHRFVTLEDIVSWLDGGASLPPRAMLVTFDDGYADNYELAFPILRKRGVPATFFLATGHMDSRELLWWDRAAVAVSEASGTEADLPLLGNVALPTSGEGRATLARQWVGAAKALSNAARLEAVELLARSLAVEASPRPSVAMTWEQAREMEAHGMSFGGHTRSHPILSRMAPPEARDDIAGGLDRMREELGHQITGFAYPNGQKGDFDRAHKQALAELGVTVAFSLVSGPARISEIMADPLEVRRIYVGRGDDPDRLRLKLNGWGRLT